MKLNGNEKKKNIAVKNVFRSNSFYTHVLFQNSDGGLRSLDSERITVDEEGTLWFSYVTREDASGDALYACAASSATR